MSNLVIAINLLSESIFGNGESQSMGVDIDSLKDEIGVPYFKGKTFKGKLREEAEMIVNYTEKDGKPILKDTFESLFGTEGQIDNNTIKFSDCKITRDIWNDLNYGIEKGKFTKDDIVNSLTEKRTFTKLDESGVAEKGSLRQARVVKRNLILYCKVDCQRELSDIDKGLLASAVRALKNIGSMETRGKGHVICTLRENNVDVTDKYIKRLKAEV